HGIMANAEIAESRREQRHVGIETDGGPSRRQRDRTPG
ncbi:MAG: hypothetical protein RL547_1381, partial [Actinomycetota bacterium]